MAGLTDMRAQAAVGVYGINIDAIKLFLHNPQFASLLRDLL